MRSQSISIKVFLLFTVILFPVAPKFAPGGCKASRLGETMTMIGDRSAEGHFHNSDHHPTRH